MSKLATCYIIIGCAKIVENIFVTTYFHGKFGLSSKFEFAKKIRSKKNIWH